MSLGVNLLAALTKRVAKTLDDSFDIEIFEMHHNKKIDAPSGTALMFGRAAAEGRGIDLAHAFGARPRRRDRRAQGGRHRLCVAARRHRGRRAQRDLRRPGRADRARPPRRGPHDLRARRAACGALGARPEARALFDGRRAGAEGLRKSSFRAAATRRSFPSAAAIPSAPAGSARGRRAGRPRASPLPPPTSSTGTGLVVCEVCGPPVTGSRINSQLPWSAVTSSAPPGLLRSHRRSCRARCRPPPPP